MDHMLWMMYQQRQQQQQQYTGARGGGAQGNDYQSQGGYNIQQGQQPRSGHQRTGYNAPAGRGGENRAPARGRKPRTSGTPAKRPVQHHTPPTSVSSSSISPGMHPARGAGGVPPLDLGSADDGDEEVDERRLAQRKKQINFGKVTEGYRFYRLSVPIAQRQVDNPKHPITPRVSMKCSKRRWDTLVASWRRALHSWDGEPQPHMMAQPGCKTLLEMGLAKHIPLDVYVAETEKELLQVRAAIRNMQESKHPQYPGESGEHPSEQDSSSDQESKVKGRVVVASRAPNCSPGNRASPKSGQNLGDAMADPTSLPYVPSPVMDHECNEPMSPSAVPQQPGFAQFIMLRVVQRASDGDESERIISVSAIDGEEGIFQELNRRFDLSKLYFKLPADRTGSLGPQLPSEEGLPTAASPRNVPKPKVNRPTTPRAGAPQATPAGEVKASPPPEPVVPAKRAQPQLFLNNQDNLSLLLKQPFAPTLYYLSDDPVVDDEYDVQRELQLTPTRYLYANCEQMVSDLIFNTSQSATAASFTPNPHGHAYASKLSPTHFFDTTTPNYAATSSMSHQRPTSGSQPRRSRSPSGARSFNVTPLYHHGDSPPQWNPQA